MPYFVDETEYLEHYGVLGMKWGVRHDRKKSDSRYKKANELMEELDKWDYGPVVNGKKVNVENFNWGKDYRTQPIEELKKTKCGVCWDFVNYQHHVFKENKIPDSSFMFIMDRGKEGVITHTWSQIELNDGKYWFENSFFKKRGLHKIKSEKDVISELRKHYDPSEKLKYDVYQYNPDGLDRGLTDKEYFDRVTNDGTRID